MTCACAETTTELNLMSITPLGAMRLSWYLTRKNVMQISPHPTELNGRIFM